MVRQAAVRILAVAVIVLGSGFAAQQVARYPGSPDLTLQTIAASGHSLNTHLARRDSYRAIHRWIVQRF